MNGVSWYESCDSKKCKWPICTAASCRQALFVSEPFSAGIESAVSGGDDEGFRGIRDYYIFKRTPLVTAIPSLPKTLEEVRGIGHSLAVAYIRQLPLLPGRSGVFRVSYPFCPKNMMSLTPQR